MSRIWKLCMMALVTTGLCVSGCESKSGPEAEATEKKEQKAEAEESKEADDEKAADEEETDFSQKDYVQAAAALSCIDSKLGDDQIEDRDKVEQNVLGKYGFDQNSYEQAESKFADNEEVKSGIDKRLEDCDEKQAKTLAGLESKAAEESKGSDQGESKPKAKPKPAYVGSLSGEKNDASGFDRASLTVTVTKDFSANGTFKGAREKGFSIDLEGKVTKDNKLSLSGSDGKNEVEVSGRLKGKGTMVEVSGSMWEKKFSTTVKLN